MYASITQGLKRAAQINRAGTATIFGERRRTWSALAERVPRFAAALRALGLGEGGRVAILALNSDDYLELHYATVWAGGLMVPINTRLAAAEVSYILRDSTPDIVIADEHCAPLLAQSLPAATKRKCMRLAHPLKR